MAVTFSNYEREVRFYNQAAHLTPMRSPRLFFGRCDAPDRFVLVLEDLSDWATGDQVAGCTIDEAKMILSAVAPVHAKFWGNIDKKFWDSIPHVDGDMNTNAMTAGATAGWDIVNERFPGAITPALEQGLTLG